MRVLPLPLRRSVDRSWARASVVFDETCRDQRCERLKQGEGVFPFCPQHQLVSAGGRQGHELKDAATVHLCGPVPDPEYGLVLPDQRHDRVTRTSVQSLRVDDLRPLLVASQVLPRAVASDGRHLLQEPQHLSLRIRLLDEAPEVGLAA